MAAIIGQGGPFTAAKNGPGPFLAAIKGQFKVRTIIRRDRRSGPGF